MATIPARPDNYDLRLIPSLDVEAKFWLEVQLSGAKAEVEKFMSSIMLAEIAKNGSFGHIDLRELPCGAWRFIGAEAAIFALFQFKFILDALKSWEDSPDPSVVSERQNAAKQAAEIIEKHFPKLNALRHAIAHVSEITSQPEDNYHTRNLGRNALVSKPQGVKLLATANFADDDYTTTRKGDFLKFAVTWESYAHVLAAYRCLIEGITEEETTG